MTLIELAASSAILLVVMGSVLTAFLGTQEAFAETQIVSQVQNRAQTAMERIVELASQALTSDAQFTPLKSSTGVDSHCLRFRLIQGFDVPSGSVIYDDATQVYIYGPDSGTFPSAGLIIGRGSSLGAIFAAACGTDGFLGTTDDDTSVVLANGLPAVELLVPANYAPQTGEMFTVNVSPAPIGRLVTFTLRINGRKLDGTYVLENDLVLTERVALRQ